MNSNLIINTITCPITHIPMHDPVQGIDGHTYERSAIISALQIKKESPIISGGCFNSNCLITMKTGNKIKLSDLKPNDEIMSSDLYNNITTSRVVCILERIITNSSKEREMVNLPKGLSITPWHPIKYKNNWTFPNDIKSPEITKCNSIITLLLDKNHIGFINGYQCIMLGHNYNNSILKHDYYGTNKIVNDMKKHPHWKKGHIIVNDIDDIFSININHQIF